MRKIEVDIRGVRNAEGQINRHAQLKSECSKFVKLSNVKYDAGKIIFCFKESRTLGVGRILAKQFSKKKYASCEEGEEMFLAAAKNLHLRKRLEIGQKDYWLIIFEVDW